MGTNIPDLERSSYKSRMLWVLVGLLVVLIGSIVLYPYLSATGSTFLSSRSQNQSSDLIGAAVAVLNTTNELNPYTPGDFDQLFSLTLELRDYYKDKDTLGISHTVTQIDTIVSKLGSSPLHEMWDTLSLCLARECGDDKFLDFINSIALESIGRMKNAQLIVDLVTANKYWDTDNVVRLSESITHVDIQVRDLNQPETISLWENIVGCGNDCPNRTELSFSLLEGLK